MKLTAVVAEELRRAARHLLCARHAVDVQLHTQRARAPAARACRPAYVMRRRQVHDAQVRAVAVVDATDVLATLALRQHLQSRRCPSNLTHE